MEHRIKYMVSADFGQTTDYTAVAVTRRRLEPTSEKYVYEGTRHEGDLHHGGRVPYRQIARGIVKLIRELNALHRKEEALRPAQPVDVGLAIDEGGVGKAVKDILVDALEDGIPDHDGEPHVIFLPVTVHGGANTTISDGYWHIPKRDLVHAGIVAFQNGTLHVGKLRHRGVLEEELKNYRLKQNLATGYAGFEPLREGQHDDLLFATCLGVWAWERAIEKEEHISYPGEWELEGVPMNVVGKRR